MYRITFTESKLIILDSFKWWKFTSIYPVRSFTRQFRRRRAVHDLFRMLLAYFCGSSRSLFLKTTKVEQFREISRRARRNVNRETTKARETFNLFISSGSKGRRMRLIKIYTSHPRARLTRVSSLSLSLPESDGLLPFFCIKISVRFCYLLGNKPTQTPSSSFCEWNFTRDYCFV